MKELFKLGGYPLIASLYTTAKAALDIEQQKQKLNHEQHQLMENLDAEIRRIRDRKEVATAAYNREMGALDAQYRDLEEGRV